MTDKATIQKRALRLASTGVTGIGTALAQEFGITRQAAAAHLRKIVAAGFLSPEGTTRSKRFKLVDLQSASQVLPRDGLREDVVWREICAPVVSDLPANVREIWQYGITEMVNNAIDHSGSPDVAITIRRNALYTTAAIADRGEGIFVRIQRGFGLYDTREAILELAKGKLTTDPENHTGEGIFFASKVFDAYDIRSGALHFRHDAGMLDMLVERPADAPGTMVLMRIDNDSPRALKEVFDQFAAPEEYTFAKTIVPVRLAQYEGEKLVSRSQAKRLTMRFEKFQSVALDFDGVAEIGQAFADEVFRVFQVAHPKTILLPVHMTDAVKNMVNRAKGSNPT